MENFSEILRNLKARFSSPLIFSFSISWLVVNWEVLVALSSHNSYGRSGVQDELIQYVSSILARSGSFGYPLLIALGYTFVGPIVKNLVSAFYAWNSNWGENWNLRILKGSSIPTSKYLSFRKDYLKRTKVLEEAIATETVTQQRVVEIESSLLEARAEANKLRQELSEERALRDNLNKIDILNGQWTKHVHSPMSNYTEILDITNGSVTVRDGVSRIQKYQINNFVFDSHSKRIQFILIEFNKTEPFFAFNEQEILDKELVGWEYKTGSRMEVRYVRS